MNGWEWDALNHLAGPVVNPMLGFKREDPQNEKFMLELKNRIGGAFVLVLNCSGWLRISLDHFQPKSLPDAIALGSTKPRET